MTTEQPKAAPSQDQPYSPPMVAYPNPHFNGGTYPPPPAPPGAYQPHFFTYAPPDASHGEANGANGVPQAAPFMYPYPPGMLYAYPPPAQGFPAPQPATPAPALKPKRKQVKMACTNCATACKRCDESRPCERCIKYGMSNTCVDGQRKERKKGVKRGPYKRKNKTGVNGDASSFTGTDGEWQPGTVPAAAVAASVTAAVPPPAVHAIPPFHAPHPEGFYPVYYQTFPHAPIQDGQNGADGAHPPPVVPFLIPAGYPPYPHYPPPPPGTVYAAAPHLPPAAIHTAARKPQEDPGTATATVNPSNGNAAAGSQDTNNDACKTKKKQKAVKNGEHQKSKKAKLTQSTRATEDGDDEEDNNNGEPTAVNGTEPNST